MSGAVVAAIDPGVLAAIVTAVGAVLVALIAEVRKTRKANVNEHHATQSSLELVVRKVDGLAETIADHLTWHVENPQPNKKDYAA